MADVEDTARVPTKMMEELVPVKMKCGFKLFFFHLFCSYILVFGM